MLDNPISRNNRSSSGIIRWRVWRNMPGLRNGRTPSRTSIKPSAASNSSHMAASSAGLGSLGLAAIQRHPHGVADGGVALDGVGTGALRASDASLSSTRGGVVLDGVGTGALRASDASLSSTRDWLK